MPTGEVVHVDQLIKPLAGDHPAGINPREDFSRSSGYQTLKSARQLARDTDRAGQTGDWGAVLSQADALLTTQAKDLEVATWLIEALVREHGIPGVRDGFRVAAGLVKSFWEQLFPQPDETDPTARWRPLANLNGEDGRGVLVDPLYKVPITEGRTVGPFNFFQYKQAVELEVITDPDRKNARITRGAISLDQFNASANESSPQFMQELNASLAGAVESLSELSSALDARCGADGPSFSTIRDYLTSCQEAIKPFIKVEVVSNDSAGAVLDKEREVGGVHFQARGQIKSREEAFARILEIAGWFKQAEPQGFTWAGLEQVVRWGRMPLPELLTEFLPDETSRTRFQWLGIGKPKSE